MVSDGLAGAAEAEASNIESILRGVRDSERSDLESGLMEVCDMKPMSDGWSG